MVKKQLEKLEIHLIENVVNKQIFRIRDNRTDNIPFMKTIFYSILILTTIGTYTLIFSTF